MADRGRDELKRFVSHVLDAFVAALDQSHRGKPIEAAELQGVARALEKSTVLDAAFDRAYRAIKDTAAAELIRNRRREPFRRLACHPLTDLFVAGTLSREILSNYFNFLHLVLGDETDALGRLCVTIARDNADHDGVDWDRFYDDERAKFVLWTLLHRIAASFKRFDIRYDWFIKLMQNKPQAVSLASHAFLPIAVGAEPEEPHPFGADEFKLLFGALFGPVRDLTPDDHAAFVQAIGEEPEKAFGEIWKNLVRIGALDA